MTCDRLAGKVGDKGQRFEIRYHKAVRREESPGVEVVSAGEEAVFGWATTLEGARQMRDGWKLAPSVYDAWVVDRKAFTVGDLVRALLDLPEQGALVVVAAFDPDDAEGQYDNVTQIGRTADGRILID